MCVSEGTVAEKVDSHMLIFKLLEFFGLSPNYIFCSKAVAAELLLSSS